MEMDINPREHVTRVHSIYFGGSRLTALSISELRCVKCSDL
jgi:hypothetical protein